LKEIYTYCINETSRDKVSDKMIHLDVIIFRLPFFQSVAHIIKGKCLPYHFHCIQDVSITVGHDTHRDKEASEEEEENEGSIIGIFRRPVKRAA